jgi:hypothetical protein
VLGVSANDERTLCLQQEILSSVSAIGFQTAEVVKAVDLDAIYARQGEVAPATSIDWAHEEEIASTFHDGRSHPHIEHRAMRHDDRLSLEPIGFAMPAAWLAYCEHATSSRILASCSIWSHCSK